MGEILTPILFCFVFFEEREQVGGGAEREGDGGSEAGFALTATSPMWGLNSRTHEIKPKLKWDTQLTKPPRHT